MIRLSTDKFHSLYEINDWAPFKAPVPYSENDIRFFVGSTSESRAICNDPFVLGVDYTTKLRVACSYLFSTLREHVPYFPKSEGEATVVNILRGGLNFGLRETLNRAFEWNCQSSAFISAQRARSAENPSEWFITEASYRKVYLPQRASLFIADVVATGVSLEHALGELFRLAEENGSEIRSVVFVTIGGIRAAENIVRLHRLCQERMKNYEGSIVLFLEGCFAVASDESPLSIKITDTDLLRRDSILAPEFLASQKESAAYPLERCTIYDAGSRAFWVPEYIEDVRDYWEQCSSLAQSGVTFQDLLLERCPTSRPEDFPDVNLLDLAQTQVQKCNDVLKLFPETGSDSVTTAEKQYSNL